MGLNTGGLYTAHSLDLSDRILDNEMDASSLENSDLVKDLKKMLSDGMKKEVKYLKEENRILKQNLLTFQDMLNKAMEESIKPLQKVLRN